MVKFGKIIIGGIMFSFGVTLAISISFSEILIHWIFPTLLYLMGACGVGFMIQGLMEEGLA